MSLGVLTTPPVQWLPLFSSMGLAYLMVKRNWLMQTQIFAKQARARRRSRLSEDFKGPKVTPIRPNLTRVALTEVETQVDKILDKLRSEGMASLTTQEKEVLDSHSKRLRHGDERL